MNKKVLFIFHLPPPVHGSAMMGQYIKDSSLINQEFDAHYINLGTSKSISEIGKNPMKKVRTYLAIMGGVVKELLFFKPDLVYLAITAKGIGFYKDVIIAFLAKLFCVPLVLHFHNKGVSDNQDRFVDHLLYKILFKNTKVILLSKYLYYDVKKYVREDSVFYCPNGIPEVAFQTNTEKHKSNTVQLLFLSNLLKSKGVFVLLEALRILSNKNLHFNCNVVGGIGDIDEEAFNSKVVSLKLKTNVTYLGKKYNDDKFEFFEKADIFVHPTFSDCFPLVLLEAMQFSLPIVSTFEGGIPDIIEDGKTGFLVKQEDSEALANMLEILIGNPELQNQMGTSGRVKYEKEFSLEHFENNMVQILNAV